MGRGIAMSLALGGHDVVLCGRSGASLADALDGIETSAAVMLDAELLDEAGWALARARITTSTDLDAAAGGATYAVEAVPEELELKRDVLGRADRSLPDDAVLTSTTSALSPTALAERLSQPERFLVTHYAQPAHLIPVCEVVPGQRSSAAAVARARGVLESCGVRPVICRDVPGFVWSRLQLAILRECVALVRDRVASAEDIEAVLKLGYAARLPAMGPFEHADLGGLDLMATVADIVWPALDASTSADDSLLGEMVRAGRLGMKSGRGFHDWERRDPDEFKRRRDEEVVRRLKVLREETIA